MRRGCFPAAGLFTVSTVCLHYRIILVFSTLLSLCLLSCFASDWILFLCVQPSFSFGMLPDFLHMGCCIYRGPLNSLYRVISVSKYAGAGIMRSDDGGRVLLLFHILNCHTYHSHITIYSCFEIYILMFSVPSTLNYLSLLYALLRHCPHFPTETIKVSFHLISCVGKQTH